MKKATLIATTLCAYLIVAGTVSAQTPVAGFSPNFAVPQPVTLATLTPNANRLIRWQGWLDVDAFSASILEQMQKQVANGSIDVGKFTLAEPSINKAVVHAQRNPDVLNFKMNDNLLEKGNGENFKGNVALYVWTYRHNFADTGLYQLYISVKGKMEIGTGQIIVRDPGSIEIRPHRDIQSLRYEFGSDLSHTIPGVEKIVPIVIDADVEIWRGAVVRVNARGELELVGNEAGVVVGPKDDEAVESVPISAWEVAPSLEGNKNYNPKCATGPKYVEPLERAKAIHDNGVQKATGSVPKPGGDLRKDAAEQGRVRTNPGFRYRAR